MISNHSLMAHEPAMAGKEINSQSVPAIPEEYKNLRWHLFETDNFEVLSIDSSQGAKIAATAEKIKKWSNERWGLSDVTYNKKCMILCVQSGETFKKWFHKADIDPKVTKSKNADGSDRDVYAIWIAGETDFISKQLPEKISQVNLMNYESVNNTKLPKWAYVGMSFLNNDVPMIREAFAKSDPSGSYVSKFVLDEANVADDKYKTQAAMMCLLLKKQKDGHNKFVKLISMDSGINAITTVYGYDANAFDIAFNSYVKNISHDIRNNQTPDMGMTWFVPTKKKG